MLWKNKEYVILPKKKEVEKIAQGETPKIVDKKVLKPVSIRAYYTLHKFSLLHKNIYINTRFNKL